MGWWQEVQVELDRDGFTQVQSINGMMAGLTLVTICETCGSMIPMIYRQDYSEQEAVRVHKRWHLSHSDHP